MGDKDLFIYYEDIDKVNSIKDIEINLIMNLGNYSNLFTMKNKLEEAKNKIINKNLNVKNFFIVSYFYEEIIEYIVNMPNFAFVSFIDEEDYRVEISEFTDEEKSHIVGYKSVNSGVGIIFYKMIGIKNLIIDAPLLNDEQNLRMLRGLGYNNLFATPNVMLYGGNQDPTWIRPEGVSLYKKYITNFILNCNNKVNIDTVIRAYTQEEWIGKISDIIVGAEENKYIVNTHNLFSYEFDHKRMNCRANCHTCPSCDRAVDYINRLKAVFKDE